MSPPPPALLCEISASLKSVLNMRRLVVNKPYAIISSSLTFWIPVMVMLTLYHRYG